MATIVASASGGTRAWSDTATWVGGVVPSATSDVQLDATSGAVTIGAAAACRSLVCTGYTNTLTHDAFTLTIGDGTAGAGNVALKLVAGMTYTRSSDTLSLILYVSTSTTQQTITTGGQTLSSYTVNGAGSSYLLADAHTTTATSIVTVTTGTFDFGGQTCSIGFFAASAGTRTINTGAANITITGASGTPWNLGGSTGLTTGSFTSSTITFTGTGALTLSTGGGARLYGTVAVTGPSSFTVVVGTTFNCVTFTMTGTAATTGTLTLPASTLTTLTVTGNSATNRLLVKTATPGTPLTVTAAAVTFTNCDFTDITAAGAASPFTGTSMGNALGNTNITFDTAATQTHTASAGGNWSDASKWTSRVPLPQDNVIVDANTTGTLTADMPRLGADVTFAGFAGTAAFASVANAVFGSLTLGSGMTVSGTQVMTLSARTSKTVTSNGNTFSQALTFSNPGGTYTLTDALDTPGVVTVNYGTFTTASFALTCSSFTNGGTASVVNLGASAVSLTSTAAVFVWQQGSGTVNGGTATVTIANASANTRSVQSLAAGNMSGATLTYTVAGSTGGLVIAAFPSNWGTINFLDASNARTLTLPSGVTTTVTSFNVAGTAGKLMSVISSTASSPATLSKASGTVVAPYLSVKDITATGGAAWWALNATNVSGNTGWIFGVAPATVAAVATVGAPTPGAGSGVTPATVAGVAAVGAPTVTTGQTVTAVTVVAVAGVGAPAVQAGGAPTVATVAAEAGVGTPTVTTGQTVTAVTVQAVASLPAPTVSGGAQVTAATVNAVASVPAPTVSAGAQVAAATVAAVASVPTPTVRAGAGVVAAVVAAVAGVGAPTVVTASPVPAVTVAAVAAVPAPTVRAGSGVVPATVAAVAGVGAPAVSAGQTVAAVTVVALAAVPPPTVRAGSGVVAATVAALASVGTVTVTVSVSVAPAVVAAVAAVGAVTVSTGAGPAPATVAAVASVPAVVPPGTLPIGSDTFVFADGNTGHVCDLGTAPSVGDVDILCANSDTVVATPSGFIADESAVATQGAYIFTRKAVGGEGSTVTVTTSGNWNTQVSWSRWANLDTVDTTTSTQINSSIGSATPSHSTGTLAATDEFVIAFGALHDTGSANQNTPVWSDGYTPLTAAAQGSGSSGVVGYVAYRGGAGTAAETPQVAWSGDGTFGRYMLAVTSTTIAAGGGDATVTPATVAAVGSVPAVTTSAGSAVAPATVGAVGAVPAATVRAGSAVAPATVAAVASIPAPTVSAGAQVAAATVTAAATVPAPTVAAGQTVQAVTVQAVASVPAVSGGAQVTAVTVAAAAAVGAATVRAGSGVAPATVAAVGAVGTVTVTTGTGAAPATVVATAAVPAPAVHVGSTPAPATVAAVATIPTPTVAAETVVTPGTVTATATIPAPTVTVTASAVVLAVTVTAVATVGIPVVIIPAVRLPLLGGSAHVLDYAGSATPRHYGGRARLK